MKKKELKGNNSDDNFGNTRTEEGSPLLDVQSCESDSVGEIIRGWEGRRVIANRIFKKIRQQGLSDVFFLLAKIIV